MPYLGYWQKLKYNKQIIKPILSEKQSTQKDIKFQSTGIYNPNTNKAANSTPIPILKIPIKLVNPDPLVKKASLKMMKQKQSQNYLYPGLIYSGNNSAAICVTKDNISRSLKIMDTFIKYFKGLGHKVYIENAATILQIGRIKFEISIRERYKRVKKESNYSWDQFENVASGFITFRYIYLRKEWLEGKTPLEEMLNKIASYFINEALKRELEQQENDKFHRKMEEETRLSEQKVQLEKEERKKFNLLMEDALRWEKASLLKRYLDHVDNSQNNKTVEYMEWARMKYLWIDPTISVKDEILGFYNE
jgi:hypothetical protein